MNKAIDTKTNKRLGLTIKLGASVDQIIRTNDGTILVDRYKLRNGVKQIVVYPVRQKMSGEQVMRNEVESVEPVHTLDNKSLARATVMVVQKFNDVQMQKG